MRLKIFLSPVMKLSLGIFLFGCVPKEKAGDKDSDGDGLTNADEAELGTDPENTDSDGDGHDDGVEVSENTDPADANDHPYAGGWAIDACRDDIVSTGNEEGEIAEDFSLPDQHGEQVRLHDFCDRTVYLVSAAFW